MGKKTKVYKIDKTLYSLKQAIKMGMENLTIWWCQISLKWMKVTNVFTINWKITFALSCLYVNDLLMYRANIHVVNQVKSLLFNNSDMKDFKEVNVILRVKITNTWMQVSLNQSHYDEKVLKKYIYWLQTYLHTILSKCKNYGRALMKV
jgi:hypothetical protein